jgi:AraC-like DNA-binding protein
MLLERLFENLALAVDPFATCAVAGGWRLRLPRRDWVVFHFILEGEGTLRLGTGDTRALLPDSLGVIPPGLLHSIECGAEVLHERSAEDQVTDEPICALVAGPPEEVELTVACGRVQVTYGGSLGLFDRLGEPLVLDFSDSPTMRATFEALVREYGGTGDGAKAMMTALMNQCLILVFRRLCDGEECKLPWLSALDDPGLARVLDAILARPEQPHSLESLAELGNMSRSVFARRFHDSFDRTPMEFVRDVRLRRGARLLHRHGLSVAEVASRVGFASRSHFSRAFSDQFGCSPVKFRADVS